MARGYQTDEIKQKLVDVLQASKTGMSGVEIAEKLGVNRITITKYLNVFAAEGLIREKKIGNVNLWFIEEGAEQFQFPDDYFQVKTKFIDCLTGGSEHHAYNLIRSCLHSDGTVQKIMTEIITPAIESTQKLYKDGKIGNSEEKQLSKIISNSVQMLNLVTVEENPKKNVIVLAADAKSTLLSDATAAGFYQRVYFMSDFVCVGYILFYELVCVLCVCVLDMSYCVAKLVKRLRSKPI